MLQYRPLFRWVNLSSNSPNLSVIRCHHLPGLGGGMENGSPNKAAYLNANYGHPIPCRIEAFNIASLVTCLDIAPSPI